MRDKTEASESARAHDRAAWTHALTRSQHNSYLAFPVVTLMLSVHHPSVNGGAFNMNAPFGGFKQSGHGREAGVYGLEEFLEYKSLQLKS